MFRCCTAVEVRSWPFSDLPRCPLFAERRRVIAEIVLAEFVLTPRRALGVLPSPTKPRPAGVGHFKMNGQARSRLRFAGSGQARSRLRFAGSGQARSRLSNLSSLITSTRLVAS